MTDGLPISLCMIVKNEENFIAAAVNGAKSVLGLSDLVVIDTGSTDRTKEIATECGARVIDFEWCNDFSAARNFSSEMAINDWVIVLDADEEFIDGEITELESFLESENKCTDKKISCVGTLSMIELSNNERYIHPRLYNKKHYKYEGSIHEQLTSRSGCPKVTRNIRVTIIHHGYLPEVSIAKNKHKRNAGMLENALKDTPDDPYLLYCLGKTYFNNDTDLVKACLYFERAISFIDDFRLEYAYKAVECYGYSLLKTEQYDKALIYLKQYTRVYDKKPSFRFLSAHILQNNGLFQEAVEMYESCIGTDRGDGYNDGIGSYLSYYNIGVILECVGMLEDAIKMYKNCGDYEPAKNRLAGL